MVGAPLPDWYDDLEGFERACWRLIARGVADRRSPFHTPVLANVGLDGEPEARTLVLRACDETRRTLRFHTDLRAAKVAALRERPVVAVTFYDKTTKLQVRCKGSAHITATADETGRDAWAATRSFSRECYRVAPAPGSKITEGSQYGHPDRDDEGEENFGALVINVTMTEALYLAAAGHRRARFDSERTWLVP